MLDHKKASKLYGAMTVLVTLMFFSITMVCMNFFKPSPEKFELTGFSGRLINVDSIDYSSIPVSQKFSLAEAIKWGNDAILKYSDHRVMIIRPDYQTAGTFQLARVDNPSFPYWHRIKIESGLIIFEFYVPWLAVLVDGLLSVILFIILSSYSSVKLAHAYCKTIKPEFRFWLWNT